MEITKNSDRINRVCQIFYSYLNTVSMINYLGKYVRCEGSFTELKFSEVTFTETDSDSGDPIEQIIEIIIRGNNEDVTNELGLISGNYIILKLMYTNGDVKIVGTPDNPVVLSNETGGTPNEIKLFSQQFSAEKSKFLLNK